MPKWVSSRSSVDPEGTHLYPDDSVERDTKGVSDNGGIAVGLAYCGTHGGGERVFAPDPEDRSETLNGFLKYRWNRPCANCRTLIGSGKLTDPKWHRRFRRRQREHKMWEINGYVGSTTSAGLGSTAAYTTGSALDVGGSSTHQGVTTSTSSSSSGPLFGGDTYIDIADTGRFASVPKISSEEMILKQLAKDSVLRKALSGADDDDDAEGDE